MYNTTSKIITVTIILTSLLLIGLYFFFNTYSQTKENINQARQLKNTEELLSQMTIEEKVGQLFLMGFWGTEPDYYITKMIQERNIGGVILFSYNISDREQIKTLTNSLQTLSTKIPLFISIDQEGGLVSRLNEDIVSEITPQSEITTEKQAYDIAKNRAKELKSLGINMNFSPVLDSIQDKNSFLHDRTFRNDISQLGSSMISGYADGGIVAVPKHFPGHGDDITDSHEQLPQVNISEADFNTYASQFISTIQDAKPQAIMVGHILFPQIDSTYPSSLSYKIITEKLRNEIGFNGLVISDDMQMGALTNGFSISKAAVQAIAAGNDILIYSGEPEQQAQAYNAIVSSIKDGTISQERLNQSVLRILSIKAEIFNL